MRSVRVIALAALLGCGATGTNGAGRDGPIESHQGPMPDAIDLSRDLEATVLEGYSQLSLGNLEAYGDTVADDVPIVLIGMGPADVHIGGKSEAPLEAFRIDPCLDVLSKNLEVHLSRDRSVGWTFDDVSCRVPDPFEGRNASIPLRVTAVYQRHLDSWVLVAQHVSYALPIDEVIARARAGNSSRPAAIDRAIDRGDGVRKLISSSVRGVIADRARYRERKIATDAMSLVLWPGPDEEYHGSQVATAPALEQLFGEGATVKPLGMQIGVARNMQIAWIAANLRISTIVNDDPITMVLRATYVYERRDDSPGLWTQVQAHVSAPIVQGDLSKRVFGLEIPDLSNLAPSPGE